MLQKKVNVIWGNERWCDSETAQDGRINALHAPSNKLSEMQHQRIIKVANEPAYADLPPNKILPKLADKGRYLASESTFYRVLKAENQLGHRQKSTPTGQEGLPG
ncbi:MAG: helix-turn-helix domain-containing protein [Proteobacteria bacterium]|nr:helix-turn-helix domain-containing protein [Pseudomonadota bacterium]